ncbi:hypothetical protein JOM56_004787 [Amanita muscaria]
MSIFSHLASPSLLSLSSSSSLSSSFPSLSPTSCRIKVSSSYTESKETEALVRKEWDTAPARRVVQEESSLLPNIACPSYLSRTTSGSLSNPITLRSWPGGGRGQCPPFHPRCQLYFIINRLIDLLINLTTRDRRLQDPYSNLSRLCPRARRRPADLERRLTNRIWLIMIVNLSAFELERRQKQQR